MENKKAFGHVLAIFTIFILLQQEDSDLIFVYSFLIGCVIVLIVISIISFSGTTMHLNPIGDILSVGAAMVWSFYAVLSKKMGAFGYSVIQTTRRTFFYGILFMIPALYFFDFKWDL